MADKKRGAEDATGKKPSRRKAAAKKTSAIVAKGADQEKTKSRRDAKTAAKGVIVHKVSARKPVSIKTARVGKRAVLPPLPPPPAGPLKTTRSSARASRVKVPARDTVARRGSTIAEIAACTEAILREKLRVAAPHVKVWMSRIDDVDAESDAPTPEAAFVRIWQWFNLEAVLDDGRVVTAGMLRKLFAEEVGRA